ncbi:FIG01130441: hypothetical protein [Streptomyces globisporus]|uniref:Uncharacterized protein n=1 Tax=Streptomyces globisporus TaxID=1908 RepID=A0ABM9H9E9_STRGL|nr:MULTISPECIES: hypothetical protein [Streptomyces]UIZ17238.1 hypothetical protein LZ559_35025 [Streptomyces sp. R527F]WSU79145.1 hypothetical protein OG215_00170 [Streptomyces globisporus]CAH9420287.1 FIG01130441: hypothetical protein [Streptomyces globisporus]
MINRKLDALAQMNGVYWAMPFPRGFRGLDVEDQDMVMLDADTAGYVSRVLKGTLPEPAREGLIRLVGVFEKVLPAISNEYASEYFTRARDVAVLAAEIEAMRDK